MTSIDTLWSPEMFSSTELFVLQQHGVGFFCFVLAFSKSCYSMQLQQLKVYPILKIFQKCPYKPWDCSSRKCISVPIKKRYSTCCCFCF